MSITPGPPAPRTSPPQLKRKPAFAHSSGSIPVRMLDTKFLQDNVTKEELGKVCYVTHLESGGQFVVTTRYDIQLSASDMIVTIEPDNASVGNKVIWSSPFS